MREVCKSGAVVAAVVAVLEKQSKRGNRGSPPPQNNTRKLPEYTTNNSRAENRREQDGNDQRSENFELAVRDFNSVAKDVEKAFSPSFPPRKNCLTIDLRSEEDGEDKFRCVPCFFPSISVRLTCHFYQGTKFGFRKILGGTFDGGGLRGGAGY